MISGADVIAFRKRRNLSRKALAAETGLTEGKIWRIENKGVINEEERRALQLAGISVVDPNESVSASAAQAEVPRTARTTVVNPARAALVSEEDATVDFASLLKTASKRYDRYVSNSEIQTFKRCRRKWWLAWYRGLRLIKESPIGVRQIGTRLHLALKAGYSPGGNPNMMLEELERIIVIDRSNLGDAAEEVRTKFEDEANLQRIMLEGYLEWIAETGIDSELEIIAPEQYIEAALSEFDGLVAIIGKIDVRVRRTTNGAHLFIDHKSVADLVTPTIMLPQDEQMLHYHLLETLILESGDQRADGALYNMLKRVKRTARAKPPFYKRVEVRHNDHELTAYRRRVVGAITDMLDVASNLDAGASHQSVAYPRPTRDCTWDCPFVSICPMFDDNSRVEDMIAQYYVEGDPLDYYQNEVLGGIE